MKLRSLYNVLFIVAVAYGTYALRLPQVYDENVNMLSHDSFIGPYAQVIGIAAVLVILWILNYIRHTLADAVTAAYLRAKEGPQIDYTKGDFSGNLEKQARKSEKKKEYSAAAEIYETLEDWNKAGLMHSLAGNNNRAGAAYERAGKVTEAIDHYSRDGEFEAAGNLALSEGLREQAAKLFSQAAEVSLGNNRVQRAAELYEKGGDYAEAGKAFESVNRPDEALRCYERGRLLNDLNRILKAMDIEVFFKRSAAAGDLLKRCAVLLVKEGNHKQAIAIYKIVEDYKRAAEVAESCDEYEEAAENYLLANLIDRAEAVSVRVADVSKRGELRARLALARGSFEEAGHHYEEAGKVPQAIDCYKKAKAYGAAANLFESQGRYVLAAEMHSMGKDFMAAAKSYEAGRDWRNAAECYETAGELSSAANAFSQAGMFLRAGMLFMDMSDYGRAVDCLQKVPQSSPDSRMASGYLAAAFYQSGRAEMAREVFMRVMEQFSPVPETLPIFYWYARFLESEGDTTAVPVYHQIMGVDTKYRDVKARLEALESGIAPTPSPNYFTPVPQIPEPGQSGRFRPVFEPPNEPVFESQTRMQAADAPQQSSLRPETRMPESSFGDGRFRVREEIDRSELSISYRADDRTTGRLVTVRTFSVNLARPNHADAVLDEAKKFSRLVHPGIPAVLDAGRSGSVIYMALEPVDGEPLSDRVKRQGPLNPKDLADTLIQIIDAVAYGHSQGALHRGLRPSNLFVRPSGQLKLVAYGIDWLTTWAVDRPSAATEDPERPPSGDPGYMAPEQITGGTLDERTDLYAIGLIMFYLSTGRTPFDVKKVTDPVEIARMQVNGAFPVPSTLRATLPEQIDAVFVKCTQKNPADRYQTADELLEDLRKLLS